MKHQVAALLAIMCAAFSFGSVQAQGYAKVDTARGAQVAGAVCVACHGADGNSPAAINPILAGQIPDYIYKQLMNFKSQNGKPAERNNQVMAGMAAALTPEDMKSLAAHFAAQKIKPSNAKNKELSALGRTIYRGGIADKGVAACASCHGPAGAGIPAQYPRLGGQYAEYTEAQLNAFRSGTRANDANKVMQMIAGKMSDKEIKAVSDYIAGLR